MNTNDTAQDNTPEEVMVEVKRSQILEMFYQRASVWQEYKDRGRHSISAQFAEERAQAWDAAIELLSLSDQLTAELELEANYRADHEYDQHVLPGEETSEENA